MTTKTLRTEFDNAKIVDFRDFASQSNSFVITCEHASNALPEGYEWSENDRLNFVNENSAWSEGALDVAIYLAKELKGVLVYSLYSRLFVDVDRDITSEILFKKEVDGREVELNKDITRDEETKRISKYYASYYSALREVSENIKPLNVVSVHSFVPSKEDKTRHLEVGVLFTDSEKIGEGLCKEFKEKGYKSEANDPFDGNTVIAMNSVARSSWPVNREGVCYNIRNDIIKDSNKSLKFKEDLLEITKKAFNVPEKIYTGL